MKAFVFCVVSLYCVLHSNGNDVHDTHVASLYRDQAVKTSQGKPSFHLRPPNNWMNDPNGPVYYKGLYHLFYQYNPKGSVFNIKMSWGHSVSHDLINWIHLNNALVPTEPFDIKGCWSGSVTILPGNKPVVLYTGINSKNQQVQNLATPKNLSDPFLKEWVKYVGNPLITPPQGVQRDKFRDPSTAWKGKDGNWRVVIGGLRNNLGVAILYRSKDFIHWILHDDPLYFGVDTGVWECPDFYPVSANSRSGLENSANGKNQKYVVKASFQGHDYYTLGRYDPFKEKFTPDGKGLTGSSSDLRYDYGKFYASKTFFDTVKKRRILWGWVPESDSSSYDVKKGWAGIQSIPRQVYLSKTRRQLVQWPVAETEKLRHNHVSFYDKKLKGKSIFEVTGVTASQVDIQLSFNLPKIEEVEALDPKWDDPQTLCTTKPANYSGRVGPFGLLVIASQDLTEQTAVFFRVFKDNQQFVVLMCSDQSRSSVMQGTDKTTYGAFIHMDHEDEMISLRSLVDHSVVESFGADGIACITARVYPQFHFKTEAYIYVFNNGSRDIVIKTLDAWSIKKVDGN
ncbi:fructan 6-exohydrolase-like [Bidens hawaiensis]|uniref:fructan 6-exohydrolase-like n=1 Tax=Bidens hawaiensis TaxID=980011 RepID=UPI00404A1637